MHGADLNDGGRLSSSSRLLPFVFRLLPCAFSLVLALTLKYCSQAEEVRLARVKGTHCWALEQKVTKRRSGPVRLRLRKIFPSLQASKDPSVQAKENPVRLGKTSVIQSTSRLSNALLLLLCPILFLQRCLRFNINININGHAHEWAGPGMVRFTFNDNQHVASVNQSR